MERRPLFFSVLLVAGWSACTGAQAQAGGSVDEIARKLQDPGAAMVSVPFQYNYLGSAGPGGDYDNQQFKVQPVIPFVGERGKFLLRPILPYQWNEFPERRHGFGDLFVQGYYIPTHPGQERATEIGFGAAAMIDTAGHDSLGTGKYSLGPAFILVHKAGKWTLGMLGNHLWSVGGDRDRDDVVITNVQPFVAYSLPKGWAINSTSEISYNWEAASGDRWTVPLGLTASKVVPIGRMPVSFGFGGFYNVERPEYANRWTARLSVTLVFPE
ncbi:hypothetical protein [Pseudoxanthomonas suwonensis]|uniref:Transporter n=1 Tax=Pseudoxanthomonas suwonensis TaxID=314722 RepID=A0A0E3Z1C2_9GAMM|nr:hypothetical protein [Pseudoxanthomonas suwonensis]AKC86687.1 hypothetical protein WQ53_07880 [Pseudoxanthomonas suwonensis]